MDVEDVSRIGSESPKNPYSDGSPAYSPRSLGHKDSVNSVESRKDRARSSSSRSFRHSRSRSPSYTSSSSNSIEIIGLTKNVYAIHLEQIFGVYGPIQNVLVPTDRYTHENTGRAYITFQSSSIASKAKEHMNGGQIDGAIIDVQFERIPDHHRHRSSGSR